MNAQTMTVLEVCGSIWVIMERDTNPCNTKVMKFAVTATLCHLRVADNPVSHIYFWSY